MSQFISYDYSMAAFIGGSKQIKGAGEARIEEELTVRTKMVDQSLVGVGGRDVN